MNKQSILTHELTIDTNINSDWIDVCGSEDNETGWIKNSPSSFSYRGKRKILKSGYGPILVSRKSAELTYQGVVLEMEPGKNFESGLVFNYSDKDNFGLFILNMHTHSYKGYEVIIGAMKNRKFAKIHAARFADELPVFSTLGVQSNGSQLHFQFNQHPVFIQEGALFHEQSMVGLYCNRSKDMEFRSLSCSEAIEVPDEEATEQSVSTIENQPKPLEPLSNANIQNPPVPKADQQSIDKDRLQQFNPYLQLRTPESKTTMDFSEAFTVPLDSFYDTLYRNSELNRFLPDAPNDERKTEAHKLDFRPRRWYRDYKKVTEAEAQTEKDIEQSLKRITYFEKELDRTIALANKNLETKGGEEINDYSSRISELQKSLDATRGGYTQLLEELDAIRDKKMQVQREVRTNGFSIIEDNTPKSVQDNGYPFHIVGGTPKTVSFEQLAINPDNNYNDTNGKTSSDWKKVYGQLQKKLLDSTVLTDDSKARFSAEGNRLNALDNSPVGSKISKLRSELNALQTQIEGLQSKVDIANADIVGWKKDLSILKAEYFNHSVYNDQNGSKGLDKLIAFLQEYSFTSNARFLQPNLKELTTRNFAAPTYKLGKITLHKIQFECAILNNEYSAYIYNPYGIGLYAPEAFVSLYTWKSWKMVNTPIPDSMFGYTTDWVIEIDGANRMGILFNSAFEVCNHYITTLTTQSKAERTLLEEKKNEHVLKKAALDQLEATGLANARKAFLTYWNHPDALDNKTVTTDIISPDVDPLADLLVSLSGKDGEYLNKYKTYFFNFNNDGFYSQEGQRLTDFIDSQEHLGTENAERIQPAVAVLPVFDKLGKISEEMVTAIVNPKKAKVLPQLPIIKFVETYQIQIAWKGYGLGELSHAFNLFPGEQKELIIEKATKLTTETISSQTSEQSTSTKQTSSFEDNVREEFSQKDKTASSQKDTTKNSLNENTNTSETKTKSNQLGGSVTLGYGPISGSINKSKNESWNKSRTNALNVSQSNETQKASNQSKEVLQKNVRNTVKKVASETSMNNRLEISTSSTETYQESNSRKEIIKIENPNIGRSVNYNFFQLQNIYEITTRLTDVKIIINPGIEVIEGSGMADVRMYELEEFNKIFADKENPEKAPNPYEIILASIVARQVFKHYGDFLPGITRGNGAITIKEPYQLNPKTIKTLNFSKTMASTGDITEQMLRELYDALTDVKAVPFRFGEVELMDSSTVTVNAGAYYMESEVGMKPATEHYLEVRRDIETEKERAEVEHLRAQTGAGVFHPNTQVTNHSLNT